MTITQAVEIPASRKLNIIVPCEVPEGPVILTYTPAKTEQQKTPIFGCLKGQIWMSDDFDEPLEDFKDYM